MDIIRAKSATHKKYDTKGILGVQSPHNLRVHPSFSSHAQLRLIIRVIMVIIQMANLTYLFPVHFHLSK